jgi:hypothetical protein
MHTRRQPLFLGDTSAQISQLHPFFFTEGGAKTLFVLCSNAGKLTKHLVSSLRKLQGVIAAILGAPPALDHSLGFEFIHQRDHAAGHYPEMFRQRLLADPRIGRNLTEQPRIWSRQPNLRNSFGKTTCPMRPQLGQEESGASRAPITRNSLI